MDKSRDAYAVCTLAFGAILMTSGPALAQSCDDLPTQPELKAALDAAVDGQNAGLSNEMWATVVNRDGRVCAVAFTGNDAGDQWPGSRVISAQKANTANAFSLPGDAGFGGALSSGNLYGTVLEGGSLLGFAIQQPGRSRRRLQGRGCSVRAANDPLRNERIGGVNVFGGGLALYESANDLSAGSGSAATPPAPITS